MKDQLGEMLLRENEIGPEQLEQARDFQRNNGTARLKPNLL